jgi:hypothetical protein
MPSIDPLILNEAGYPEGNLDEYEEASGPYIEKQRELLVALSEFAREEFQ